ncbi:nucleotidyltransferase family protein [Mesorhizobium sp. 1B3]|uniref:nucleotidyltransferase family protein n=1 Tax=Mesorhizobium sp. 1B3 TaxID=3243599 RepID=UPI003D98F008
MHNLFAHAALHGGAVQGIGTGSNEPAVTVAHAAEGGEEIGLLKYALRAKFGVLSYGLDPIASSQFDAATFYSAARLNKLVLLLSAPVLNAVPKGERDPLGAMVERYKARTVAMNARAIADTLSVSAALTSAGIAFVVMKGVCQQRLLYGEYFAKPVGDVDILVGSRDYGRARAVLETAGFAVADRCRSLWWRFFLGEQHMVKAGNPPVTVDLHYRLQQPGSPSPREPSAFIRQHETMEMAGARVPVISRMHRPLLSAISIAKALFNREACGGYVLDFYASVRDMADEERLALMMEAERQGLGNTVLLGFRAASLLFGERFAAGEPTGPKVLRATSDDDLAAMVLTPWASAIRWPCRRDVLRELCGRDVARYTVEAGWAATADLCRRWFERGSPAKPRLPTTGQALPGVGA